FALRPILIPKQESLIFHGNVFRFGSDFRACSSWVKGIRLSIEPPAAFRGFKEYPRFSRIWRAVRDAVLNHMNVYPRPNRSGIFKFSRAPNNFIDWEIVGLGMLLVQLCSS